MQSHCLPCQLEHRADPFFGIESGMRGAALDFDRKHAGSLPRCLHSPAARRWFQNQYRARLFRFRFDQTAAAGTAAFFIAGQENGDWRFRLFAGRFAGAQDFECQRAIGLHIKDARSKDSISFDPPRALFDRTTGMNGVCMAEDHDWCAPGAVERADQNMITKAWSSDLLKRANSVNGMGDIGK